MIAFRVCDPFDCLGAESTSREESEVWRVEELLRVPVHPESQGNLSSDSSWVLLILLVIIFLALAGVGAGLTYYVTTTINSQEAVTPQTYLLSTVISLNFTDRSGGEHEGWLLLGLRGAPAIILCHGYDSNRSDLLVAGKHLARQPFQCVPLQFSWTQGQGKLARTWDPGRHPI